MKKNISKWVQGSSLGAFLLVSAGCAERGVSAAVPVHTQSPPVFAATSAAPDAEPSAAANDEDASEISQLEQAPATVVQSPVVPDELELSAALEEIVRMVQAGVSEDVLLAYIDASKAVFGIGSDEIVFLTDLGVSETVLKRLIEHDALPESRQRKLLAEVKKSLPENLAVDSPATNVYPVDYLSQTAPATGAEIEPAYAVQVAPVPVYADSATPVYTESVNYFYDSLAPYGSWVLVEGYGLCWQPTVVVTSPGWRPYFDRGRWIYSDHGWYWLSDYSWGWAPFHYGRWFRHHRIGWCWTPDLVWGPSWVSWRYSRDYCGWAPLPPGAHFRRGTGFTYYGRSVSASFSFGLGYDHYAFVPFSSFCDYSPYRFGLYGHRARNIFHRTTVINNITINNGTIINNGVDPDVVAEHSRVPVRHVEVRNQADFKGNRRPDRLEKEGNQLVVYRPTPPQLREGPSANPRTEPKVRASGPDGNSALVESPRGQANRETSRPVRSGAIESVQRPHSSASRPATERVRPDRPAARESETIVSRSQSGSGTVETTRSRDELRIRGEGTTTGAFDPRLMNRPSGGAGAESSTAAARLGDRSDEPSRPDFNPMSRVQSSRPGTSSGEANRNVVVMPRRTPFNESEASSEGAGSRPFRPQPSVSASEGERTLTFTPRRRIIQPPAFSQPVTPSARPAESRSPTVTSRPATPTQPPRQVVPSRTPSAPAQVTPPAPSRPTFNQPITPSQPSFTPVPSRPSRSAPSYSPPPSRPQPSAPSVAPSRPTAPSIERPSGSSSGRPSGGESPSRNSVPSRRPGN